MEKFNLSRLTLFSITLISLLGSVTAQELNAADSENPYNLAFEVGLDGTFDSIFSTKESTAFRFSSDHFSLIARASLNNDGKYDADLMALPGGKFIGQYVFMDEGGATLFFEGLRFRAGRLKHYDIVNVPFSLFVNSTGLSANMGEISYENAVFLYTSRWIELNHRSGFQSDAWNAASGFSGFPERGANMKTYALKLGTDRIGFQDGAVYTGRNFDFEYLANPIPQYFIQYFKGTGGRPWTTGDNENNFIGLFWDRSTDEGFYYYVQTLLDDFSLKWILPETFDFPYKLAWTFGAKIPTDWGIFGFHHGGATRYSFEPITTASTANQDKNAYGYTYYPETRFDKDWLLDGFQPAAILFEDNMVGYKYGENSAVFLLDWSKEIYGFPMGAEMEVRISGDASPANPWHDINYHPPGTRYLDDPVLETRFLANIHALKKLGDFEFSGLLRLGFVWNERSLRAPNSGTAQAGWSDIDNYVWIWTPVSGADRFLFAASLGVKYKFEPFRSATAE